MDFNFGNGFRFGFGFWLAGVVLCMIPGILFGMWFAYIYGGVLAHQ